MDLVGSSTFDKTKHGPSGRTGRNQLERNRRTALSCFLLWSSLLNSGAVLGDDVFTVPAVGQPGDFYRLAFITRGTTTATSSNIADYNAFVTAVAHSSPELLALNSTWKAIVSTPTVHARDNTDTNFTQSQGVSIFTLDGDTLGSNLSIWNSGLNNGLHKDEFEELVEDVVWTGTNPDGTGAIGLELGTLASAQAIVGHSGHVDTRWISDSQRSQTAQAHLYAISTETFVVPELDYGDAPQSYDLSSHKTARHVPVGPQLGLLRDAEPTFQYSSDALADDVLDGVDDEDGVVFSPAAGFDRGNAAVNSVTLFISGAPAEYRIWIDWNQDGEFGVFGTSLEYAGSGTVQTDGSLVVNINVPSDAVLGQTYARFRVFEAGRALDRPVDLATTGEVEDYRVTVTESTLVDLLEFKATPTKEGAVLVEWTTAGEVDTAGFRLFRHPGTSAFPATPIEVTRDLIPAAGSFLNGAAYRFIDSPGYGDYTYTLKEYETNGRSHTPGTASVTVAPRLSLRRVGKNEVELMYNPIPGMSYEVQFRSMMVDDGSTWNRLNTPPNSGTIRVPISDYHKRFFRLLATTQ